MFSTVTRYKYLHICAYLLFISVTLKAQNNEIRVSVVYNNVSVISFLNDLEKKHQIVFFYNPEWFRNDTINLFFRDTPLEEALQRAIKHKSAINIISNNYVFLPNDEVGLINGIRKTNDNLEIGTRIIGDPIDEGKYSKVQVTGTISDAKNGEPLIGAMVQVENTNIACVTNLKGYYSLTMAPGIYNMLISNIGYEKSSQKFKVISNGEMNLELFDQAIKINEIIINARKADRNVRSSQMSIIELDSKSIKQLPSLLGEKDIIKSFTMMPGVKSVGEFGSGINIRGGGTDQNLFLIEGAPLFNTSHAFGLISVVNPDIVNDVTLYKGHIPSNIGERVSSVMDIHLKDNIPESFSASGGIGIFNSRLLCEIPLLKHKLSVKVGGRTSYSDWLLKKMKDKDLKNSEADFYDFSSIVTFNSGKNRITATVYASNDNFKYSNYFIYNYKNNLGSVSWNHYTSRNLTSTLLYSYSYYNLTKESLFESNEQSELFSGVKYHSLKYNQMYSPNNSHTFDAGFNGIFYTSNPGQLTPGDSASVIKPVKIDNEKALEGAIYLNDKWEIDERYSINAGIRYSVYTKIGPGTTYNYPEGRTKIAGVNTDTIKYNNNEIMHFYNGIEPRIAVKMQIDKFSSLKLSFNRNKQYISLISNTAVPNPNDFWKLSDKYIKPVSCNHLALGYYRNFNQNKIETSVELYYKALKNQVEYKNSAKLDLNPVIETALTNADGKNYGVELYLKKNSGKLDGWVSYTFSRSLKKTSGVYYEERINNNRYYPSTYDKPNEVTLLLTYHINKRVRIAGNFDFSNGRVTTLPTSKYTVNGISVVQFAQRNSYRLPDYHRLDLSLSVDENLKRRKQYKGSWTLSVINVYGRKNVYSVYFTNEKPTPQNHYQTAALYKLYIIGIPLVNLTYNFMF